MGANDWSLLVDFDHARIVFPPHILATSERPDMILSSLSLKKVILIELTCPAEENILSKNREKLSRYERLKLDCKSRGWTCVVYAVEVGARGFVAQSLNHCLRRIGFKIQQASKICKLTSVISARCSYTIFLSRSNPIWSRSILLTPPLDAPPDPRNQ